MRASSLVRPASADDLASIGELLVQDAAERAAHDRSLWPTTADAAQRIAQALGDEVAGGGSVRWLVAEAGGVVTAVARFGLIPCPPIYHLAGGSAFVLLEDTHASASAPADALASLIAAAEREARAMGAVIFLAACAPFQRTKLRALEAAGYSVVTQYLVKHELARGPLSAAVRPAAAPDVADIVAMSAKSQRALCEANAQMWKPHPDAPARFAAWMTYSLTLVDRRIFVSSEGDQGGFVIAQPVSPFHMPLSSARGHMGLIDDFWAASFAATEAANGSQARDLLNAAEIEFGRRGMTSAMLICPAAWPAKNRSVRSHGYRDGTTWMLKGA